MVSSRPQSAFSLVELSIVLVILGLLTGGILAGQSLIRAAELRAVASEYTRWVTATQTFRDKYFMIPGDLSNATSFWGAAGGIGTGLDAPCRTAMQVHGHTGTCNGDGDGTLASQSSGILNDASMYWDHLVHAGFVEGNYAYMSPWPAPQVIGVHTPVSKITASGWFPCHTARGNFGRGANNMLILSKPPWSSAACGSGLSTGLSGPEAWNIDTKIDDGQAGHGRFTATNSYDAQIGCITSAGGFSAEALPAAYVLNSNTQPACHLYVLLTP